MNYLEGNKSCLIVYWGGSLTDNCFEKLSFTLICFIIGGLIASHETDCLQWKRNLFEKHRGAHRLATNSAEPGSGQMEEARNRLNFMPWNLHGRNLKEG